MSGMSGRFLLLILFFFLSFAGDENKDVTELCGTIKADSSQWFSVSLVELMSDSVQPEKDRVFIFEHHNGKRTIISYNAEKKIFFVKRNYQSKENPAAERIKDPLSGQIIFVEWEK